ncbi:MAG TPA: phytoene/squalene synthase family protein [bacterium]|nr:phytoene/squalene synthase family protein [bacterium]HOL48107.1 phytoene/squalene synthase family protein [bacterium]HPQ18100.1 phytoene/squalene synthase family protein [bacterium]
MKKELINSYIKSLEITKNNAKNFYYSFLLLPPKKKFSIYSVYAFCRIADDIADSNLDDNEKLTRINEFEKDFKNMLENKKFKNEIFHSLKDVIKNFKIEPEFFLQIIEGMKMDIIKNRYNSFNELYYYCLKVAGTVAFICSSIFLKEKIIPYEFCINLGLALQMTNIIRDIKEDKDNNRIYLPLEDLNKFNYSEEDLKKEKVNSAFFNLIKYEIDKTKQFYKESEKNLDRNIIKQLYTLVTIKDIYYSILLEIEKNPELLYSKRFSISIIKKLNIAIKNYLINLVK